MTNKPSSGQIAAIGVELFLFTVISFYGIKWLAKILDPTSKQKESAKKQAEKITKSLGINNLTELSEYEVSIAALLVDPLNLPISWNNIGGLESVICEIKESVILPFQRRALFSSSTLLSAPKGVLLYGPPGCGKTMIAKATAKQAGCRFINLEVSSLTDKWYGESQKLASAVFSLASKIQPCIIFIDEIDSFLRARESHDNEATAMMKAQFMSLWDGLLSEESVDVIIMAATNRPQDIDRAILRRLPCRFHIGLPQVTQRMEILQIILQGEDMADDVDLTQVANHTEGYSGCDLKELCRLAALQCLRRQVVENDDSQSSCEVLQPIKMSDFLNAYERMKTNDLMLPKLSS
ncbi:outer mitochondrial transmembrane helix translocase-like isoform X2 [Hydractinia symbiolongicarpus]|uniref:outer mitochondrial transmembrane helix translocase-like isoform X2 n=1 Tax=Hydractinia symbiolongicarpus TaxID=13093 RepID=UPI002550D6A4|nr:outer mitochondrial transmembrane helix translocase-like isoform X2 [Hydractinia symbiolongicarpus]